MAEFINRDLALSHPFANGHYDREHANEEFIFGHESYREWLEDLPYIDMNKWSDVLPVGANRWIPVSEKLPDDDRLVLACVNEHLYIAWYCEHMHTWLTDDVALKNPSAWMPLPKPYREEDEM